MGRVAAISAGPRSASPRGRRAFNFCGFLGFSAMGGVGISACATRQPCLLLPLPLLSGRGGGGAAGGAGGRPGRGDAGAVLLAFPPPTPLPARAGRGSRSARAAVLTPPPPCPWAALRRCSPPSAAPKSRPP